MDGFTRISDGFETLNREEKYQVDIMSKRGWNGINYNFDKEHVFTTTILTFALFVVKLNYRF